MEDRIDIQEGLVMELKGGLRKGCLVGRKNTMRKKEVREEEKMNEEVLSVTGRLQKRAGLCTGSFVLYRLELVRVCLSIFIANSKAILNENRHARLF